MKKNNLLGIFALTMLASSFSSCTKTVYVPASTYYDNMATNKPTNKGSEWFYSSGNKSNNNNYKTAPSLIDIVNNNEYQRPDRPQPRPIADGVAMEQNQRPTTDINPTYNTYPKVAIIEEVQYEDPYERQVNQPVPAQVQSSIKRAEVQPQGSAPTPTPTQQQYNYSNAPATKKISTPVSIAQNTQQYYYNTPEVTTYNRPAAPVQQDVPFSQYFDQNVTIFFKNGAKLDGIISRHPKSNSKAIIRLADDTTYECATKDIHKVDYKY